MSISPSGIIDFFEHPPVGMLLQLDVDAAGPYAGVHTLPTYEHPAGTTHLVGATYGCMVQLNGTIPAQLGLELGWYDPTGLYTEDRYTLRLCQFVVQHQTTSGLWISTQVVDVFNFPWPIFWTDALPGRVGLRTLPGISVDLLYWPKPL
jgi:hypothetical protein